ncbi:MAG: Yip1 family protein [Gemmatimonadota bacterium]|nr:Yip1 family protein [Gemmatimonadota bacterium]
MSVDSNIPSDSPRRDDPVSRGAWARIRDTALLDRTVYDEVARDRRATPQAACVVILASVAVASSDYPLGWMEMAKAAAAGILQWWVWAAIAHVVGGKILGGNADWGALIRVLGFARGPGIFAVLAPLVGGIHLAAQAWVLVAGTAALRATMGFGTGRALVTALVGMVPYWSVQLFYLH